MVTSYVTCRLEEIQKLKVAAGSGKGSKLSEIPDPPKGSPQSSDEEEEEEDKGAAKAAKHQQVTDTHSITTNLPTFLLDSSS